MGNDKYPNLEAPVGSFVVALEAITSGNRGEVAWQGKIYIAKAEENITAYKECVVINQAHPRGIVERRSKT